MPEQYRPAHFDLHNFSGQFILTAEKEESVPENWTVHTFSPWHLYTLQLPVAPVYDETRRWLGWCIGHPVIDGAVDVKEVVLRTAGIQFSSDAIDDFYGRASGKWALLLVHPAYNKIFLDPYASLSTVYSTTEKRVVSTPSLFGPAYEWDEELINAVGLPEQDSWLPAGLTTRKGVRRLLPNHCLNTEDWTAARHWPTPETDFSVNADTKAAVQIIAGSIKNTITAISKSYPLCFSLTAGMDSRMLLACARDYISNAAFFTFVGGTKSVDTDIPALLAQRFRLNHRFIPTEKATPDELEQWLALTGMSTSGAIWKIHKSLTKLDPKRVLLPGTAGEIGRRTMQWRDTDRPGTKLSASDVLIRCKLPEHPALLKAVEAWIAELSFVDTFTFLALVFVEQRLGCWAAPQHYGNTTSAFEFTPFNSRQIFHTAMRLPHEYRRTKQLPEDIIRSTWPELLNLPFNQFTGVKGYMYSNVRRMKKILKDILHRG